MAEPVPGISAIPDESNSRYFHVVVSGPKDVNVQIIMECFSRTFCSLLFFLSRSLLLNLGPSNWNFFYPKSTPWRPLRSGS